MNYRVCLIFVFLLSAVQFHASAEPPKGKGYSLLLSEEFEGDTLNTQLWRYRLDRRMTGLNRAENVSVGNGCLQIDLRQEILDGKMENTGGGIISWPQLGYGYYECYSKPFTKGGVHCSFWQSRGRIPNNDIFEIDSYEIYGGALLGNNNLYMHVPSRKYDYCPYPIHTVIPFSLDEHGWFLDGFEYTPEGVIFYDNGEEVARSDWGELTAAQCVWITALNLRTKKNENLPDKMLVDYFRYYGKDYPGYNILPNGDFEYNSSTLDPYTPTAWEQSGTSHCCKVKDGNSFRDLSHLRISRESGPFEVKLFQKLEYIMDGYYTLSAMVRSSGIKQRAVMKATSPDGLSKEVTIPKSDDWILIQLENVEVKGHQVEIAIDIKAEAGQWIELDDVNFFKPSDSGLVKNSFRIDRDPFWSAAEKHPIVCKGDGMIIGLSDNIGTGNTMSMSMEITPERMDDFYVFGKLPEKGKAGRGISLRRNGDVVFHIGSRTDFVELTAHHACQAGVPCVVTCVYDNGDAFLYVNHALADHKTGISQNTNVGGGRFGDIQGVFSPINDKMIQAFHNGDLSENRTEDEFQRFVGKLSNIRFYNRAIVDDAASRKDMALFLLAGQSNAQGIGGLKPEVICPLGTCFEYDVLKDSIVPLVDPVGQHWKLLNRSGGSICPAFASTYHELTGMNVCMVTAARSGSSCSEKGRLGAYNTWDESGDIFSQAVEKTSRAMELSGSSLSGIIWIQGERDANAITDGKMTPKDYAKSLENLIKRFRSIYGKDLPVYIVLVGNQKNKPVCDSESIRKMQSKVARKMRHVYVAYSETPSFAQKGWLLDNVHYCKTALNDIGTKVAIYAAARD